MNKVNSLDYSYLNECQHLLEDGESYLVSYHQPWQDNELTEPSWGIWGVPAPFLPDSDKVFLQENGWLIVPDGKLVVWRTWDE